MSKVRIVVVKMLSGKIKVLSSQYNSDEMEAVYISAESTTPVPVIIREIPREEINKYFQ